MSDAPFLPLCTSGDGGVALPLHLVKAGDEATLAHLLGEHEAFLRQQGFEGRAGQFTFLPGGSGVAGAVFCVEEGRGPMPYGALPAHLKEGYWQPQPEGQEDAAHDAMLEELVLGFCLGAYDYSLKHEGGKDQKTGPKLCIPASLGREARILARAAWLGRDLINMPANLMGPAELATAARRMLEERKVAVELVEGEALEKAYPCLAAVGAGSDRPAVVVIGRRDGRSKDAPRLSLVGKGVCFDTGGYDIKPGSSMAKMKKDMGGAALMLALACALLDAGTDIALEIRLGCVENSVSGHAMRPGDVLTTRRGLRVEVGNTDAEGRLVLADLLAEAAESQPDVLLDAATLTGAARVALGPDLPALFSNDEELADHILTSGREAHDPLWQLPLWADYDGWMDSSIADCNNLSSRPMAGAITAALFLQRFVPEGQRWAHVDTYAWNDTARPGRPAGGEVLALRALFRAFSESF
ncbi:leucyl aminopeptidase family protein [Parasaccharibacter apium]|uniref:Leucyl aminopeptidase n=1 Tax=Parasaccharibacter apium TaxID=1510841 RepID=A0ABX4ZMS4_9PROT|nr:leucyl aminopeptidase family protein [Parasaccharibacter apium]POS63132.1 leucyl aminopeptidase [Parasaccharibacter apium]POS63492.1 leucyl aminopeptidase [Parasaccharibacter apium]POS64618.1 leucyl aminopeptidase [Parasaccharibacter apium]